MIRPLDLYWELVRVLKEGDDVATRRLIAPDFVLHEDEGMPYGGVYHGADGFLELVAKVWATWGGSHFDPQYQLEDPESGRVCTIVLFRGTPGNSTEPVEALINEIWTFRNGRAVEARVWYYDTPRLVKAINGL